MKGLLTNYFLIGVLILTNIQGYSQWNDYSFSGKGFSYSNKLKISGTNTACLVGYYNVGFNFSGRIFKTINAGASISLVYSGGYSLQNLYFFDELNGIAVGESDSYKLLVCRTNDGGTTWTPSTITSFAIGYDVQFVNSQKGFIGGSDGILASTNGGNTWTKVSTSPGSSIGHISFPTSTTGYAISKSGTYVYKSTDGGDVWNDISSSLNYSYALNNIYFINENIGFILPSNDNKLFKTTNGGVSWSTVTISGNGNLYDIKFLNSSEGYISGELSSSGGCIYKTVDGGNTWTVLRKTSGVFSYYGFDFKDNFCVAAGFGGYSKTTTFNSTAGLFDSELDSDNQNIKIFPNPSTDGTISVNFEENINSIRVVNTQGIEELHFKNTFNTKLKGLLIVIVQTNTKTFRRKILVE